MQSISLNLDIEKLNEYFHFYDTEADYAETVRIGLEATGLPITQSYEDYVKPIKTRIKNQTKNLQIDFDLSGFKQLLEKNHLEDKHDELLFASVQFKISYSFTSDDPKYFEKERLQKLEYYKALKYILCFNPSFGKTEIRFLFQKDKKSAISLNEPEVVFEFLEYAKMFFARKIEEYDYENDTIVDGANITMKLVNRGLIENKSKKPGVKPTKNWEIRRFGLKLLDYLNKETKLKTKPGVKATTPQLKFILELLNFLKINHPIKEDGHNPANHLHTIIFCDSQQ